ncbi:acyl-CoA dehydrogenase family protein [Solicola gregarius]|uniref:Acyl-CoA dehydrogenase family protein n=1 Tax=Solicola gregarius TaxID=2908642 RepID=A0AA46TH12_9ACTN|nr:acyl-CoA dehydrogenase family protein [Solicola gregarius]UYM04985.1 acyl-CoA dehydrogenase family protein [Solicola gregarius]
MSADRGIVTYRRDAMGYGLAALNRIAGSRVIERLGMRKPTERVVFQATKTGFRTLGAVNRTFVKARSGGSPSRTKAGRRTGVFDLTPTDDQQMIVSVVKEFATEAVRPAADKAEAACETPHELLQQAAELGLTLLEVPDDLGGLDNERTTTTGVLVAESLAHGDMGLAVACLAPASVATALSLWGSADQQQTYLPSFTGEEIPSAALAIAEPTALFDPLQLRTTAKRTPGGGYTLNGVKSAVVRAAAAELFVIAADLEGSGPALFIVESNTSGLEVEADPSMGLRAASLSRVVFDDVRVSEDALLGDTEQHAYRECIRLSRIAWSALAVGTAQAVLDYVTPYVKERKAFGEPIAYRQSVAFMVANIGIELEGMRLATYRAASRAEQGLDNAREVALARRLCSEYGMKIGQDGVQLLGGHGFVKEHPVERWYRDLRAVGVMEGSLLV